MKTNPTNPKGKLTARRLRRSKERSDVYYYLVTVSHQQKLHKVKKPILNSIINLAEFYQEFHIINKAFETSGRYKQLHCHLIVWTDYPLKYTDYNQSYGYQIHYVQLQTQTDLHQAQIYVSKDQYNSIPKDLLKCEL